jgi:hypothetical protein
MMPHLTHAQKLSRVGMHKSAHVLALPMTGGVVWHARLLQAPIAGMFVGRNKINSVGLTDKAIQGNSVGVLNYLANHVALAGGRTDKRSLTGNPPVPFARLLTSRL